LLDTLLQILLKYEPSHLAFSHANVARGNPNIYTNTLGAYDQINNSQVHPRAQWSRNNRLITNYPSGELIYATCDPVIYAPISPSLSHGDPSSHGALHFRARLILPPPRFSPGTFSCSPSSSSLRRPPICPIRPLPRPVPRFHPLLIAAPGGRQVELGSKLR
jgi:hypothetical protein